jgi:AcrR family transcriptional regulator
VRVKSETKRLGILEAAKSVFIERGYEAASMAEVAARASCSKQTLYSYFTSKEELFVAVMLEKGAIMTDPLFRPFDDSDDLPAALRLFAGRFLYFACDPEILAVRRIIYAEGAKSDLGKMFFENGPKRGWTRIAEHFARAMDDGHMRRADPWLAVQHLSGLCEAGPVQGLLDGSITSVTEVDIDRAARAATDVFIRAYEITSPAR